MTTKRLVHNLRAIVLFVIAWLYASTSSALAQAESAPTGALAATAGVGKLLTFDVASIRLDKTDNRQFVPAFPRNGDGVTLEYAPLEFIIRVAFGISHADTVVSGLPDWAKSDHYTIRAKVAGSDVAEWRTYPEERKKLVLQQLLADRFKLVIHTESLERPIYELVTAPGGFKIKNVEPAPNNTNGWIELHTSTVTIFDRVSMPSFVSYLSRLNLGRELQDRTGLTGNYNFKLEFTPTQPLPSPSSIDSTASSPDDGAPSIFVALQEQLGLKLVPTKGPVVSYVVDHVERPAKD